MVIKTNRYKTENGQFFDTLEEAEQEEVRDERIQDITRLDYLENDQAFAYILLEYYKIFLPIMKQWEKEDFIDE